MAAFFTAASSQYLLNSVTPITAAPFSVGMWLKMPTSAASPTFWSLNDSAADNNGWYAYQNASNQLAFGVTTGASFPEATTSTAIRSDAWLYVVLRAISATNRRISVRHASGAIDNAQNTTSVTPTSLDLVGLGASVGSTFGFYIDGSIAEYWMANVDIHPGGGALPATYLHQLAYNGPFSVPHIERNLVDYRSFRESITSDADHQPDYYLGGQRPVRQVWTNVNGATLGPHVPLPGYYERPATSRTMVLV